MLGEVGGKKLHRKGNFIPDDGRQRHHEQEVTDGKKEPGEIGPAQEEEHHTVQTEDQRGPLQEILGANLGKDQLRQAEGNENKTEAAGNDRRSAQLVAYGIDKVTAQEGDEIAMGIIIVDFPVGNEGDEKGIIESKQGKTNKAQQGPVAISHTIGGADHSLAPGRCVSSVVITCSANSFTRDSAAAMSPSLTTVMMRTKLPSLRFFSNASST